jgi:hypothetical protein
VKRGWLAKQVRRPVLVHTTDDNTVAGLLALVARDGVVLRLAELREGEGSVAIAGETFILRERIAMIQVVGARDVAV